MLLLAIVPCFTGSEAVIYKLNQSIHLISGRIGLVVSWPFVVCLQFLRNKDELADGMIEAYYCHPETLFIIRSLRCFIGYS